MCVKRCWGSGWVCLAWPCLSLPCLSLPCPASPFLALSLPCLALDWFSSAGGSSVGRGQAAGLGCRWESGRGFDRTRPGRSVRSVNDERRG